MDISSFYPYPQHPPQSQQFEHHQMVPPAVTMQRQMTTPYQQMVPPAVTMQHQMTITHQQMTTPYQQMVRPPHGQSK